MSFAESYDKFIDSPTEDNFKAMALAGLKEVKEGQSSKEDFAGLIVGLVGSEADFLGDSPYVEIITICQEVEDEEPGAWDDLVAALKGL